MNCRCSVVAEVCREFREQKTNKQTNKKIQQKTNHIQHQGRGRGRGSSQQIFLYGTAPTPFQSRSHLFESIIIKMYDGDFFFFRKLTLKLEVFAIATPPQPWNKMGFFFVFFFLVKILNKFATLSRHQHTHTYTVYRNRRY